MKKLKMQVSGENEGIKSIVKAGRHELIVDEGSQVGGNDEGPNPLQYMLIALAGCENVVAHAVAKEMAFDLQGLTFDISGEFDPRGFMGDPNVRTYFETVTINVKREDNGIRRTFARTSRKSRGAVSCIRHLFCR
ncbi:MAG TPA: OsmC family protein [Bacillota bacterium]|nr:OsmC family protein [Bacillota bacterium]